VDGQHWEQAYKLQAKSAQSLEDFSGFWNERWLSPDTEDWKLDEIGPELVRLWIHSSRGSLGRYGDPRVKLYELVWRKKDGTWRLAESRQRPEDDWD
jgi:hypothetical protein